MTTEQRLTKGRIPKARRVRCPLCLRIVCLTKRGFLFSHDDDGAAGGIHSPKPTRDRMTCSYSGWKP